MGKLLNIIVKLNDSEMIVIKISYLTAGTIPIDSIVILRAK